jgi:hypothetical protein
MEAKAAAVSLSAPLLRCRISSGNNLLVCSARRLHKCRYYHAAPLRSHTRSFPAGRVYASAAATTPAKEQDLVFVAGATGKVGSRTVRYSAPCSLLCSACDRPTVSNSTCCCIEN